MEASGKSPTNNGRPTNPTGKSDEKILPYTRLQTQLVVPSKLKRARSQKNLFLWPILLGKNLGPLRHPPESNVLSLGRAEPLILLLSSWSGQNKVGKTKIYGMTIQPSQLRILPHGWHWSTLFPSRNPEITPRQHLLCKLQYFSPSALLSIATHTKAVKLKLASHTKFYKS